ncbi:HD domain-containing protein [Acinetobacter shaoyimingii]|uniref:HD domain-containing protein n=1 Tax=Acinetobacter shaoyimingii TaxID=2715164 RepID=UPI00148F5768|nr:metal-dependent hydrolase [Acinetobacter shaoyimingii]
MSDIQDYSNRFQDHWMCFATVLDLPQDTSQNIYRILSTAYNESQRAYHTCQHIVECLDLLHDIRDQLHDPIAVEMAIWFHDVVYDPKSSENELRSAELMKDICSNILNEVRLNKVYAWIVATQHHQPTDDADLQYLLDIDLAILASEKQRFEQYEQQVRFEYSWVESSLYQIKRQAVLQHLAQMQPLYQTSYFQQYFEEQAKLNLQAAIDC